MLVAARTIAYQRKRADQRREQKCPHEIIYMRPEQRAKRSYLNILQHM